jgi:hypothetical protein
MSPPPDPFPREIGKPIRRSGSRHGKKLRRRSHSNARRGRIWLILIFLALRGIDALYYFGIQAAGDKSRPLAAIATNVIWTTALLCGIWFHRDWCRAVLIFFLALGVLAGVVGIPSILPMVTNNRELAILGAATLGNAAVAWILATFTDIKRLANRSFD